MKQILMAQSDCHVYTHPLCYDFVEAKVYYRNSAKLQIDHIEDLKQYRMKFKTEMHYWYYVINHIKEKVLIKLPNLRLAKIYINTLDKNNVIHQFIISVSEYIGNLLKRKFSIDEMIFIYIQYGHDIKFIGNI
uniref:Uncharacterized protein n=1 Tax=viral metagenome TaxID=1070528 RepID=A0A6C0D3D8_9ZZZZ